MWTRIDGKIGVPMWSRARAQALAIPLLLIACKDEIGPGSCPEGATRLDSVCRKSCTSESDCLLSETCDVTSVCVAEPITDTPKVKRFEVDPVPVTPGEPVHVDYAVVSADRLQIRVEWSDGTVEPLLDSTEDHFGTEVIDRVSRSGVVELTATRNGVDQVHTRAIELDDGQPRIVAFEAEPARVSPGSTVAISWQVANATAPIEISIEGGAVLVADAEAEGELDRVVEETTTFLLRTGELSAKVVVEVVAAGEPEILSFDFFGPNPAPFDHPVSLVWRTRDAVEATVIVDGLRAFTARSPAGVDSGAAMAILPAGAHLVSLEVQGAGGATAVSSELEVLFASRDAPVIDAFDHPLFIEDVSNSNLVVSWSIAAPDPLATAASFAWSDMPAMPVGLQDRAVRLPPDQSLTATLRADSPAGAAEVRGTIFQVTGELEPNDDPNQAQELDFVAVQAATSLLDADTFSIQPLMPGQSIVVALHGDCPISLTLEVSENGTARSDTAQTNGDCPRIELTPSVNSPIIASVTFTVGEVSFDVAYRITAEVRDPICGDGVLQGSEQCDAGDRLNGDGCSADCLEEDVVRYALGTGVRPFDPRPDDARQVELHPYPNDGSPIESGFGFLEIPGGFTFFERMHHAVVIHADGFISFVPVFAQGGFDPTRPLDAGPPNDTIAVLGADLRPAAAPSPGGIFAWIEDGALMIEYDGFVLIGNPTSRVTARVVLEPNGEIWIGYPRLMGLAPGALFSAGLQDKRGGRTLLLPGCDPACDVDAFPELNESFFELIPMAR